MTYSRRVVLTTGVSILAHIALLWVGQNRVEAKPKPMTMADRSPMVFRLEQPQPPEPEPEPVHRIIETPVPAEDDEEIAETDLASDHNSKARDESDETGERVAPATEEPEEFDAVEHIPTEDETVIAPVMSNRPSPPEEAATVEPEMAGSDESEQAVDIPSEEVADLPDEPGDVEVTEPALPAENIEERFQVAQAEPQEQAPPPPLQLEQNLRAGRVRDNGSTLDSGVINFEARKHELGEFMLEVRKRVELQWHAAIQLRYGGVKRAEAVILCSIRPDGMIESLKIVDAGPSMTFAILCRDAIQRAAPFPKLGFDVPEIYRSRNVDIRWRFSYM